MEHRMLLHGLMVLSIAACAFGARAQEPDRFEQDVPPSVPEHFAATDPYIQGLIVEVLDGGLTLLLDERSDTDLFGPFGDGGTVSSPGASFDSFIGIEDGGLTVVTLGRAQGWLFFDDPDGGRQRRIRLIEARDLFKAGHVVQISRAPGMPSSASHAPVSAQGRSPRNQAGSFIEFRTRKRVTIEGWLYVRLNTAGTEDDGG